MRQNKFKVLEHITLVKGCIKARPGYTDVRGKPDPHILSSRPDGSRDLSATENCQLLGPVIVT